MKCYGKESGPLLKLKKEFFDKNDQILREHLEINRVYAKQPKRKKCKNCDGELGGADFKKLNVEYSFCLQCGHLNGLFEDTKEFCAAVYTEDQGKSYGQQYSAKDKRDYWQRVSDIYQPKAAFLKKALIEQKEATRKLRYIDLGAGSGYFVQALRSEGMVRAKGFEVSEFQVELGNSIGAECGEQVLHRHSLEALYSTKH